jgi:hypothetical protein
MAAISRDLFYQLLLTRWEAVPTLQLAQPLHVGTLMELALRQEEAAGRWQVRGRVRLGVRSSAVAGMQVVVCGLATEGVARGKPGWQGLID